MEENQTQPVQPFPAQGSDVGFPSPPQPKGKSKLPAIIFAILGVIIILAVGGWILFRNYSGSGNESSSSSEEGGLTSFTTPSPEPTETPSPTPATVSKEDLKIEIYNGTGTAGDASSLKSELVKLGYSDITPKNAESQSETVTTVTFSTGVSSQVVDEISKKLNDIYADVSVKKGTISGGVDIKIVTGPRKSKSAVSSTASPSASPTPSPSPTSTP